MLEYSMTVKLLTGYHLEFLSLKGGCTGSSASRLVKMPPCRKSHVVSEHEISGKCVSCSGVHYPPNSRDYTVWSKEEDILKIKHESSSQKLDNNMTAL